MSSKVLKLFLAGLFLIIILVAAYFSYSRLPKKSTQQAVPAKPAQQPTLTDITKPLRQSSPSASNIQEMKEAIEKQGRLGSSVFFKDCDPNPQILKADSLDITFNNSGTKEIKIGGIPSLQKTIKGGESVSFKIESALYPYSCQIVATSSATPQIRGIIYVPAVLIPTGDEIIKNEAKNSSVIEIDSCKINPPVVKINQGSTLTFKNTGQEKERIYLSKTWDFNLSASEQNAQHVKLQSGIYRYSCESKSTKFVTGAGTIYIP